MDKENLRRLSSQDASKNIGLFPIEKNTYFLPGLLIRVVSAGLEITYVNSGDSSMPEDTIQTNFPFEFHAQGKKYLISSVDGQLVVDEVDVIAKSDLRSS